MKVNKLASLATVGLGAGACFLGYNLYSGDYVMYSRYVVPSIRLLFPDAEKSHILAIKAARHGIVPRIQDEPEVKPFLNTKLWDIEFNNPVGLAAGFDKDGEAIAGLSHLGFGFLEVGSVTPVPQKGNFYPRVFRLLPDRAIINRYGFNSLGHDEMEKNLDSQEKIIKAKNVIVGLNLGKNRDTEDAAQDYLQGLRRFYPKDTIRYFVINISSPNTPNLREMQNSNKLTSLLDRILREKKLLESSEGVQKPLLLKLAPDLTDCELEDIAKVVVKHSKPSKTHGAVDGLIISNTTITRPDDLMSEAHVVGESGGLSGPPLRQLSTEMIRKMYRLTKGTVPIVGVGGIESGKDAYEKIAAGASLVQLYTSMTYFGPTIAREVKRELALILAHKGYKNVQEVVGIKAK